MLWLNFAPILSFIQKRYAVSETAASLLLLIFPLTYVLLSLHAGTLTDRRGYRYTIGIGALLMAGFSCARVYTGSFLWLCAAQTGISLGQPYVVNGITKLVSAWFPADEAALATGLGTVGLFVGMALGMALTPIALNAMGFTGTMAAFAALSVVSAAAFFVCCPARKGQGGPVEAAAIDRGFWQKAREPQFLLLFFISFLGLGYFNGFTSWIEAILATSSIHSEQAGIIGGVLILGGILGSALIPAAAARLGRRKPLLIVQVVVSGLTLVPLCRSHDYGWLLLWGFLQGFFFLPAFALLLDLTALRAGERFAGSATGVLMLAGNAGGVLAIFAMGLLKGDSATFPSALPFLGSVLAVTVLAGLGAQEPSPA